MGLVLPLRVYSLYFAHSGRRMLIPKGDFPLQIHGAHFPSLLRTELDRHLRRQSSRNCLSKAMRRPANVMP